MASESREPYKNAELPVDARVEDLLKRMTLAEKAGQMFHNMIVMGEDGSLAPAAPQFCLDSTDSLINEKHMSHFNLLGKVQDASLCARWHNRLQELAAKTRLGIPVTISTDPRNHFVENMGTAFNAGSFSQWPEPLGLAALRSTELMERFADIARQEYLATGIRVSLSPQIDLATEPRWARISATYGEDAELSARMGVAYVRGFQAGNEVGPTSVSCMGKHFPGGGPQKDGEDPHFSYGREQIYPGNNFEYHLKPFKSLIAAGVSQMMPYYGMPCGTQYEEVGFAFNKQILTDLLREKLKFQGIICSDWGLVTDKSFLGEQMPGRAWGIEDASELERTRRLVEAGCDQLGGESCPELVIELCEKNLVSESRIDQSIRRLLREKFQLGLFDNPYLDAEKASNIVGNKNFCDEGDLAQRRSFTLLTNRGDVLPLRQADLSVYAEGLNADKVRSYGFQIVDAPSKADVTILRLKAPFEKRPGAFESMFHAGSLAYAQPERERIETVLKASKLAIVDLYLDRPAVVPELKEAASALLVNYGASDAALLDVITGNVAPEGKLPFDLPSSMKAVLDSRCDCPFDTADPLFKFGHGLSYKT